MIITIIIIINIILLLGLGLRLVLVYQILNIDANFTDNNLTEFESWFHRAFTFNYSFLDIFGKV